MSALRVATLLIASSFSLACGSPAPSNSDTVSATSSTPPAVTVQPVDSATVPVVTGGSVAPNAPKAAPKRSTTVTKPAGTQQGGTTAKRPDSIIGYDSIIRMPIRRLPTASPTPTR